MTNVNNKFPPDDVNQSIKFSLDLPPSQIRGNHRSHFRTFRKYYKNFQEQGIVALHNALLKTDIKLPFEKQLL